MLVIGVILEIQNVQNSNVMLNMFVIIFLHFVERLVLKSEVFVWSLHVPYVQAHMPLPQLEAPIESLLQLRNWPASCQPSILWWARQLHVLAHIDRVAVAALPLALKWSMAGSPAMFWGRSWCTLHSSLCTVKALSAVLHEEHFNHKLLPPVGWFGFHILSPAWFQSGFQSQTFVSNAIRWGVSRAIISSCSSFDENCVKIWT